MRVPSLSAGVAVLALGLASCKPLPPPAATAPPPDPDPGLAATAFEEKPDPKPEPPVFLHDKSSQVSILLYHEFSASGQATDMVLPTEVFREQMRRIKESGVAVIGMGDFLAWKRGEKNIPDPSIVITMDDGWKSVHTEAFPILRQHGFPFTIFLYTNYIASGSRSLAIPQIKEMMAHGATIGCHSRSHPYPQAVKSAREKGPDAFTEFLQREMVEPAFRIESLLGERPRVYAYPGGFHTPEMFTAAVEAGYHALFTVNPGKVVWESDLRLLPRYVILGDAPSTFANATSFRGVPLGRKWIGPDHKEMHLKVSPPEGATIPDRMPEITADLSPVPDLDPGSLLLRVSGLGVVPHQYDPATRTLRYQMPVPIRAAETVVFLYWKRTGESNYDAPMVWKFRLDRRAALMQTIPPAPAGALPPPPLIHGS